MYQFLMSLNHYMKNYRHFTYIMVYYKIGKKIVWATYSVFTDFCFAYSYTKQQQIQWQIYENTCIKNQRRVCSELLFYAY